MGFVSCCGHPILSEHTSRFKPAFFVEHPRIQRGDSKDADDTLVESVSILLKGSFKGCTLHLSPADMRSLGERALTRILADPDLCD